MSSNHNYNSSSFSSSSYSYSSSSSTNPDGTSHSQRFTETRTSNDRDGTNIHRTHEETGRPDVKEDTYIPPGGRLEGQSGPVPEEQGRIRDVTDEEQQARDREYEERMEDEYAKREGGA